MSQNICPNCTVFPPSPENVVGYVNIYCFCSHSRCWFSSPFLKVTSNVSELQESTCWLNQQDWGFPMGFLCFFPHSKKKKRMAMYGLLPGHTSRIRHDEAMTASVAVTLVLPLDIYHELLEIHQWQSPMECDW